MTAEDLKVIYEDNQVIVVIKPQNIPVQADSSEDVDLLSLVKEYVKVKYDKPGDAYIGLVHRLDRPTGGVMVFARTSKAASRLSESIRNGEMSKKYFAVVVGEPKEKAGKLVHYLKKNPTNNTVMIVPQVTEGAKRAELDYRVLDTQKGLSLVDIDLITGRSHQARVQMASLRTPIFGDQRYAGEQLIKGNLALWAVTVKFEHPVSHEKMVFTVYPPTDEIPWKYFDVDRFLRVH